MKYKSLYKTITWRAISVATDVVLSVWLFDDAVRITAFVLLACGFKSVAYYGHEKLYKWIKRRKNR
jgi:uncharacterized membrane protein